MKNYKELEIYNLSYELAVRIHKLTISLPKYEMYEEGSQIRRSSKSITSNIVEGYGRRKYKADFIKFLIYSHSSNDETILHLNFIKETHENIELDINELLNRYDVLGRKINRYIQYVEMNWNAHLEPRISHLAHSESRTPHTPNLANPHTSNLATRTPRTSQPVTRNSQPVTRKLKGEKSERKKKHTNCR